MDYGHSICDSPDCQHPHFFHGVYGCLGRNKNNLKAFCDCRRDLNNERGTAFHGKLRAILEEYFGLIETEDWFRPEAPIEIEPLPRHEVDTKYSNLPPEIRNKLYYPEDYAFEIPGEGVDTKNVQSQESPKIATSSNLKPLPPHFVRAIDLLN
ncbi:hypothetical protein NTE_01793 [Candidatus Nitrososphaera evergladensis SR1]|uniref:Uncharacterized protein n=1 Tax=Candidatus Nitrososphaera evergladensis SR1 TaxID=1459636 RepID=A0A075MX43_9ARCH|nr:hypothetical protein NTE_01793 [Candidatus Nitrososphaera evergladensis SR1]